MLLTFLLNFLKLGFQTLKRFYTIFAFFLLSPLSLFIQHIAGWADPSFTVNYFPYLDKILLHNKISRFLVVAD
jgi:hypothetical protein